MKVNGKLDGEGLDKVLGKTLTILGTSNSEEYEEKIKNMDRDQLYRHGMNEFGIRPSASQKGRATFENRCVKAFKKSFLGSKMDQAGSKPKKQTKKKDKQDEKLDKILSKLK